MKINYEKAKHRLTIIASTLIIYVILIEPLVKWFSLEKTHPLSAWYFAIILPICSLLYYAFLGLIIYLILTIIFWIFGIEKETK